METTQLQMEIANTSPILVIQTHLSKIDTLKVFDVPE